MSTEHQCSFCGRLHYEVAHLIASPSPNRGIYICTQCLEDFLPTPPQEMLYHPKPKKKRKPSTSLMDNIKKLFEQDEHVIAVHCSFCGRFHRKTNFLIVNKNYTAFICDRCLEISQVAVDEYKADINEFISYWEKQVAAAKNSEFTYEKQKHLLRQIEDWIDYDTSQASRLLPLLDAMLELDDLSEKIAQRIVLVKSGIEQDK